MLECIVKKPLAALALAAASVAALAVPAGAAVPKRPASQTVPCNDGSGKAAQIWQRPGELAAKNPCSTWLVLGYGTRYASGAPANAYALAARPLQLGQEAAPAGSHELG